MPSFNMGIPLSQSPVVIQPDDVHTTINVYEGVHRSVDELEGIVDVYQHEANNILDVHECVHTTVDDVQEGSVHEDQDIQKEIITESEEQRINLVMQLANGINEGR